MSTTTKAPRPKKRKQRYGALGEFVSSVLEDQSDDPASVRLRGVIKLQYKMAAPFIFNGLLDDESAIMRMTIAWEYADRTYKADRGTKYSTYVAQNTAFCLRDPRHKETTVRVHETAALRARDLFDVKQRIRFHEGRHPSIDELAEAMGIGRATCLDLDRATRFRANSYAVVMADADYETKGFHTPAHTDETLDGMAAGDAYQKVRDLVDSLPEKDADIIRRRFGIGCDPESLSSIAKSYGCSAERIRQVQARVEGDLRRMAPEGFEEAVA